MTVENLKQMLDACARMRDDVPEVKAPVAVLCSRSDRRALVELVGKDVTLSKVDGQDYKNYWYKGLCLLSIARYNGEPILVMQEDVERFRELLPSVER